MTTMKPSGQDDGTNAIEAYRAGRLTGALRVIAHGRIDNGRPLSGPKAQEIAQDALFDSGDGWGLNVLRPAPAALLRARMQRCAEALDGFAAALDHAGLKENAAFARQQAAVLREETV
jgi:hypothetical protein